jgi:hypothetical protein
MQRVTITVDDDLIADLHQFIVGRGYTNRSEAVRPSKSGAPTGYARYARWNAPLRRNRDLCLRPFRTPAPQAAS